MGWNPITDSWGFGTGGWSGLEDSFKSALGDYFTPIWDLHVKIIEESFALFGFEGETIYSVQVVNQQLIPDKQTPFTHKIILHHVIDGTSISAGFQLSMATGIHSSVIRYLRYGNDYYVNTIPELTNAITGIPSGAVDDALTDIEGTPVTIFTAVSTYLSAGNWIRWWLQENTAYTYHNDQIPAYSSIYEYTGFIDTGTDYTAEFIWLSGAGGDPATYDVTGIPYENGYGEDPVPPAKPFVIASYALDSAINLTKIWIYDRDSGVYPDLDPVENTEDTASTVLPIVAIRKNFINLDDPIHLIEYESARKLLKKLDIDIDAMIDSLSDPEADPPGSQLEQIEDAFILFTLNLYSESIPVMRAIRKTFTYMEQIQTTDKTLFDQQEPTSNPTPNIFAVTEDNYNIAIQHNYIETTTVVGSIGAIGYADSITIITPSSPIIDDPNNPEETIGGIPQSTIVFREQFDNYFLVTVVHGLTITTGITTTPDNFKLQFQELDDAIDRKEFSIPLIMSALTELPPVQQEEILYAGMTLTVYAQDSQYLEWYETAQFLKTFQIVLVIVAVVIAFWSGGSAATVLFELVKNLAYQYALSLALQEVLRHNLSDDAKILVYIGYAAAAVYGVSGFSFNFDNLVTADTLLFATNSVTQAYMTDISMQIEDLTAEYSQFQREAEERQKILNEANSRFQNVSGLTPLMLTSNYRTNPYESVTGFYERTIHTGNPGTKALDQVKDFHKKALELPELN